MSLKNYSTTIDPHKTIGEIQKILVAHGARAISIEYNDQDPVSLTFFMELRDQHINFRLPARIDGVLRAMKADKKVPRSKINREQATRVGWRIVRHWIEQQMAMIESEMAEMAEIFLPYSVDQKSGLTLWDIAKDGGFGNLLSSGE